MPSVAIQWNLVGKCVVRDWHRIMLMEMVPGHGLHGAGNSGYLF